MPESCSGHSTLAVSPRIPKEPKKEEAMSFYPELDDLNLEDLTNRFRMAFNEARKHGSYSEEEEDLYYAEVAGRIRLRGEEGIGFLKSEVCNADTARLRAILSALAWPKFDDPSLPELFLLYLNDQRPMIVAEAVDGLSGQEVKEAVDRVLQLLSHSSPYVRGSVLRYMRQLYPDKSFSLLVTALKDPDYIVRENAVDELDYLGNQEAISYLYPLLKDSHPDVRQAAQTAIENLKDIEASSDG